MTTDNVAGLFHRDNVAATMPRMSLNFNTPMTVRRADAHAGNLPAAKSHLTVEPSGPVQCAWKQADYSDATIVRIYNPTGQAVSGKLRVGFDVASACETDFREEPTGGLTIADGAIALNFTPYEIKTVRLADTGV